MAKEKSRDFPFCLVPLDTEGEWNLPLLENAASLSGGECLFASSGGAVPEQPNPLVTSTRPLDDVLSTVERVIACEAVRDSGNVYDLPAPRQRTAVLVGNEVRGIPRFVLKKADAIVAVPMSGAGMSSVNVAVSAAIALYVLSHDLGRRKKRAGNLSQRDIDLLIHAPENPHELGSLLRSVWSFGWKRVFVSDPHGAWFTRDSEKVLEGRAAARRAKNPLAVLPLAQMDPNAYDRVLLCDGEREGAPLSRLRLPSCRRLLVVYGRGTATEAAERVFVDHAHPQTEPRFRHAGSILLSMISQMTLESNPR